MASGVPGSNTERGADFSADSAQSAQSLETSSNDNQVAARRKLKSEATPPQLALTEPSANKIPGSRLTATAPALADMRMVRGQVTDLLSGAGLSGVTVLAQGTAIGVSTAADGSFALAIPQSVKALVFNSAGYRTSERIITPTDSTVVLALAPATRQLSEVVVRREPPPAPMAVGALPTGGYPAFRNYLKQELSYPEKALKEGTEGTVKLRFVVAADGSLQDIKVLRRLSEECDAEAIRLLMEGPRWYPAILKGRRTVRHVEISVPFRLVDQR